MLDFLLGLLVKTDKYIEVADGCFVKTKQTGEIQIKMHDDNGIPFITKLQNVLFATELCDRFFIITLMKFAYTCLFHKGFYMVFFCDN